MENKDLSKIKWGEIYTCDLGKMKGSVQCGVRPVLVVQTNKLNGSSPTVVVAVITSVRKREDIASHIPLETDCGLNEPSMVILFIVGKNVLDVVVVFTEVVNSGTHQSGVGGIGVGDCFFCF